MASKYQEKFEMVEKRIKETGMNAKDVCRELRIKPTYFYTWRSKQKQSGAKVIVHTPKAKPTRVKASTTLPQGYIVFGSAEFLKAFVGAQ